tara:strand:- start:157 stop:609 length:453 start_codon:yes stop_codon:yes gene_type:complete
MSHWLYENKILNTIPNGHFGFVYLITNLSSGRKYIGRKYFYSTRRIKVKGRKTRKVVRKESDWKHYIGSNKTLKNDINRLGKKNFKFEILCFGETKGQTNYLEENFQHRVGVILDDDYYNGSIGSRKFISVKFSNKAKKIIRAFNKSGSV